MVPPLVPRLLEFYMVPRMSSRYGELVVPKVLPKVGDPGARLPLLTTMEPTARTCGLVLPQVAPRARTPEVALFWLVKILPRALDRTS